MTHRIVAEDENALAAQTVSAVTATPVPTGVLKALLERQAAAKKEQAKNPAAVALGRLGGLKGGKARAEALSPKKRSQIAKAAAKARWGKEEALLEEIGEAVRDGETAGEVAKRLGVPLKTLRAIRKEFPNQADPFAG